MPFRLIAHTIPCRGPNDDTATVPPSQSVVYKASYKTRITISNNGITYLRDGCGLDERPAVVADLILEERIVFRPGVDELAMQARPDSRIRFI